MFTLLIIGKSLNRYTNIYNTLAASMLFLLIWNPFFILDVGFQLSYLAVLGIVSMQVGIYNLWKPQSKLLDKIWTITSVSIAAQMSTFPLGLLYFHQFPNYFLISNLIVIPLSTLLLYIGMAVCAVFKIKWLVAAMCKLLTVALWLLNSAVSYFEKLPNAVIQGIGLTNLEAALIYAFLLSAFLFLKLQHIRFLKITLLSIILLVLVIGYYQTIQQTQKKMIVYHIKKHSALDFIDGNTNYFFSDSALLWNKSSLGFHVKQNWWNSGINKTYASSTKVLAMGAEAGNFKCKNFIIYFYTKKILCLRPQNAALIQNIKLSEPIDYIIVSGNSKINFAKLKKQIRFHQVIFDSSNSPQKIKFWKRQCEDNSISYFDVNQRGAFVVTL
jgi:competence protein ComEC